uniref:Cell division cycle-associated protein 3 n=1 Tax=Denticeps clupeoides TaxID=299321 RepID=A0AAY4A2J6_9TELE
MGSSESKIAPVSTPKGVPPESVRPGRVAQLADPRSPTTGIERTPIQVLVHEEPAEGVTSTDPRSPTHGITRTPMKDIVRVTMNSFARRLGVLFLGENGTDSDAPLPRVTFSNCPEPSLEELGPAHTQAQESPCCPSEGSMAASSPFMLISEVELETRAQIVLEEAVDLLTTDNPPFKKDLSLSLLTCHDGVHPSVVSEDEDNSLSEASCSQEHLDHSYAHPSLSSLPPTMVAPEQSEVHADTASLTPLQADSPQQDPAVSLPSTTLSAPTSLAHTGLCCPSFDPRSPSQLVFKPQWLAKGFGVTEAKARGLHVRSKGACSPLTSRKLCENENKGALVKTKQRGKVPVGEGRSPLKMLKETNSPRDHSSQVKLKVSTSDRQRIGQVDRRALVLSINKENQR